jgi:hypothetical protein
MSYLRYLSLLTYSGEKDELYEVLEIGRKSELLARFFAMFQGYTNKCWCKSKGQSRMDNLFFMFLFDIAW